MRWRLKAAREAISATPDAEDALRQGVATLSNEEVDRIVKGRDTRSGRSAEAHERDV
ncbi:MAG: hypothetical protein ACLPWO_05150 [Thermoplasmata archaeon]